MAFNLKPNETGTYDNPETLFNDNRQKNIKGLLSNQADTIRAYMREGQDKKDVSIQLATGAGKTLIGMLLGEWHRINGKKVIYLCPNKQLAMQVGQQAEQQYGIQNYVYVGRKSEYSPDMTRSFLSHERVAITTYSSLFNVNPFFRDSEILILDDVHQAQNLISSLWSVTLDRNNEDHEHLYETCLGIIRGKLPKTTVEKLLSYSSDDGQFVDKLPIEDFYVLIPSILEVFEREIGGTDQIFSWRMIRNNLHGCNMFYSGNEFMIRPLYPPTSTFSPFNDAIQRIYMSATLGNGGDLERIVGVPRIYQLETPDQWSDRIVGRRFFSFPGVAFGDRAGEFLSRVTKEYPRRVYIAPSNLRIEAAIEELSKDSSMIVFRSHDIESSKDAFTKSENATLFLANRYDGIDFPDDDSRILIIDGFPKSVNLQEHFFLTKLGLKNLYQSRIVTRIIQAFGRTTRNTNDFSLVIVLSGEIINFLFNSKARKFIPPELNAEIEFGINQENTTSIENTLENIRHFLSQTQEWQDADRWIIAARDKCEVSLLPYSDILQSIVEDELSFNLKMWNSDYSGALINCKNVLAKITSSELRGMRGLWNYFAGSCTALMKAEGMQVGLQPEHYYGEAAKAANMVTWLHQLKIKKVPNESLKDVIHIQVDRIENFIEKIGNQNSYRLDKIIDEIQRGLDSYADETKAFETAQVELGTMLGFSSGNKESDAAPDPWWIVDEKTCFVFEDYTGAEETSELSATKARQASSHKAWIKENLVIDDDAEVFVFLVSTISKSASGAKPHTKDIAFWSVSDFNKWAKRYSLGFKEVWSDFPGKGDMFWRERCADFLNEYSATPTKLISRFNENIAYTVLD